MEKNAPPPPYEEVGPPGFVTPPGPGMAAQPGPGFAAQPGPGFAAPPGPGFAAPPGPGLAAPSGPGFVVPPPKYGSQHPQVPTLPPHPPIQRILQVGPNPQSLTCPYCHERIVSRVITHPNTKTHLLAIVLCFICLPLGCIPYLVDSCQSRNHFCPSCSAYLGVYDQ